MKSAFKCLNVLKQEVRLPIGTHTIENYALKHLEITPRQTKPFSQKMNVLH